MQWLRKCLPTFRPTEVAYSGHSARSGEFDIQLNSNSFGTPFPQSSFPDEIKNDVSPRRDIVPVYNDRDRPHGAANIL